MAAKGKLTFRESVKQFSMPAPEALAQMGQQEVVALANQLNSRHDRLALITKWSMLKLNLQRRTDLAKLSAKQEQLAKNSASQAQVAALECQLQNTRRSAREALAHQAKTQKKLGATALTHRRRLDNQEQAIAQVAEMSRAKHRKAMKEIGGLVLGIIDNDAKIMEITERNRQNRARFDFLTRQAAYLRQLQKEEALARQEAESRVHNLEAEMSRLGQEQERASRFILELPEMRLTRSLVLMSQGLKEHLSAPFRWRGWRVALAATGLLLLITAFTNGNNHSANAKSRAPEQAVIQCSFYNTQTGEHGIVPSDAKYVRDSMYFVLNCGTVDAVELYGTLTETLPKDGIFAGFEVIKITE